MIFTMKLSSFSHCQFECCGVDGYKDFKKAKKWKNERVFWSDNTTVVEMIWPIACCKVTETEENWLFANWKFGKAVRRSH